MQGGCSFTSEESKWDECVSPGTPVTPSGNITVLWSDLTGGKPQAGDPGQILAFQWTFAWAPSNARYAVDLTLDDVAFVGDGTSLDASGDGR
ncbi:MAG TPA: hypothetical protein VF881_00655 [Polyangiaceae bacterium]